MGLLELCLLPLLTAQEPAPAPAPSRSDATVTAPSSPAATGTTDEVAAQDPAPPDGDERERLLAAERAGPDADPDELRALTDADDVAVAARAAWLLGRCTADGAEERVRAVATGSPHAPARLQAMHALQQKAQVASLPTAVSALEDEDRSVRTLAAQLLGRLRRPAGVEPLVALVERGERATDGADTDLQAALIALHDLGATGQLVRVATALDDAPATGVGEALTFCFQELSPKLATEAQSTLLVGVLAHREPLLRRYAIGRLAELRLPSTAQALEGRLAKETDELRPLVEVALAQVRGDDRRPPTDELERATQNAEALWARAKAKWDTMPTRDRAVAAAIPVSLLLVVVILAQLRRRRRRAEATAAALALVAPSEEHLEHLAAEAEELAAAAEAARWEQEAAGEDGGDDGAVAEVETDGWGEPVAADDEDYAEEPNLGGR